MYEKNQRKLLKEKELAVARNNLAQATKEREIALKPFYVNNGGNNWGYRVLVTSPYYPEYKKKDDLFWPAQKKVKQIESELQKGNY